jgi:biopolymer transport protein TolR
MGMSGGGSGNDLASEINVTPLVDVMLVLLIIFMVTAPMLNASVDLELPQAGAKRIEDKDGKLILSIDKAKQIRLGDTPIKWVELAAKLASNARVQAERELYIEADRALPYGVVIQAMAIAQEAGAVKLQMVTDPNATEQPLEEWDRHGQEAGQPIPGQH